MKIEAASTAIHMNGSTVGSYDAVRTDTVLLYPKSKSHSPPSQAKGITRPKVATRHPHKPKASLDRRSSEGRHSANGGATRVRASDVRRQKSYVASKADPIRHRLAHQTHL